MFKNFSKIFKRREVPTGKPWQLTLREVTAEFIDENREEIIKRTHQRIKHERKGKTF